MFNLKMGNSLACLFCSWHDIIKSTVDVLKKSGTSIRLHIPPGVGITPLSPTTYVLLFLNKQRKKLSHFPFAEPQTSLCFLVFYVI